MTHRCHISPCKLKADKADGEEARPALCYEKTEERKEDKNGNKILPVDYKYLVPFGNYFISQSLDGLYGVIDWD